MTRYTTVEEILEGEGTDYESVVEYMLWATLSQTTTLDNFTDSSLKLYKFLTLMQTFQCKLSNASFTTLYNRQLI